MSAYLRVMLADRQPLFRRGVAAALLSRHVEVIREADAIEGLADLIASEPQSTLLIGGSAIAATDTDALRQAAERGRLRVIVFAADESASVNTALDIGALGIVDRHLTCAELLEAVKAVGGGEPYVSAGLARQILLRNHERLRNADEAGRSDGQDIAGLDLSLLRRVGRGATNQAIANELGVSLQAVKYRLTKLYRALAARSRMEAIAKAERMGLVPVERHAPAASHHSGHGGGFVRARRAKLNTI